MKKIAFSSLFKTPHYALLNAVKAAIASLIGYLIGCYLGHSLGIIQMYNWIVVTVLVVMSSQPNLGGAVDKALMRFLGTTVSASVAILIIYTLNGFPLIELALSLSLIMIGVFIANAIPRYTYAGVLGAITTAITMFGENISVAFAFYRTLEVLIGIIIALCVNRFIFPIRAEKQIAHSFSEALLEIRTLQIRLISNEPYEDLLAKIFNHFSKQIDLIKEIKFEKAKVNLNEYQTINRLIRRLYRYLCVIYEYIDAYPEKREKFSQSKQFLELSQTVDQLLISLAHSFNQKITIDPLLLQISHEQLDNFIESLSVDQTYRHNNTLAFSLKSLLTIIENIITLQKKIG
ncbi:FUSC family protein [Thiotrichales bacterium 19S11-10]|nr:FUSC family protein [Thiotrichales bacterium 19S11-10]